jgi:ferredoxin
VNKLTKIYYFSATGNTLWSAKMIAEQCGGKSELVNIGVEAQKEEIILEAEAVILLYPAFAYGPPLVVRSFLQRAVIKTPYFASFVTYGTSPGGAQADICRIIKHKHSGPVYFGNIPAVENYIAIFGPQSEKTVKKRCLMQKEATVEAVKCVLERRTNSVITFRPFSVFIWLLFTLGVKIFYKWYKVNSNCNSCGTCEKLCPVSAIVIKAGRPSFTNKCEHCNGCINWCPQQAIGFGRVKSGVPRYHHPEISIADITR